MNTKQHIAFLGLGAMGSRMAINLIKAGYPLTVWNRSDEACLPLVEVGATIANSPKEAVKEADIVISMVKDDKASEDVWLAQDHGAILGIKSEAIAIESSTLTPKWVLQLGKHFSDKHIAFLEAPVSGSRPQAEAGNLVYFVGGDKNLMSTINPILDVLGSNTQYVGDLGSAALVKLSTNALLGIQVAAYAEIIGILQTQNIDPQVALNAIKNTSVWSPVAQYLSTSMIDKNFMPQFPVALLKKDFDYMVKTAEEHTATPLISLVKSVLETGIEKGYDQENMTVISKLYPMK